MVVGAWEYWYWDGECGRGCHTTTHYFDLTRSLKKGTPIAY